MEPVHSSNYLETIVEHSPTPIAILDEKMNYIIVSHEWMKFFNLKENIVGKNHYETLPFLPPSFKDLDDLSLSGKMSEPEELKISFAGKTIWLVYRSRPWVDKHGKVCGLILVCEDNTESRREEIKFQAIFEQAGIGITQIDKNGRYTMVNQRYCDILGYSESELLGRDFMELTYEEDRGYCKEILGKILTENSQTKDFEKRYIRKDGSMIWAYLSVTLIKDEDGEPLYFITTVTDISRRKAVENALVETEKKFRVIFDQTSIGLALTSVEGRILGANQKMCDIVGYKEIELLNLTFQEFTYGPDLKNDLTLFQNVLDGKIQTYSLEKRYVKKDGSLVWAFLTVSPVRDRNNIPLYFIAAVHDITERKNNEAAIREYQNELENKVLQRTQFLTLLHKISSEVNNTDNFDDVLNLSLREICKLTEWQIGHFHPVDPYRRGDLKLSDSWFLEDKDLYHKFARTTEGLDAIEASIIKRVITSKKPFWSNDVFDDQTLVRSSIGLKVGIKSGMAFPVFAGDEVAGVLEFYCNKNIHPSPALMELIIQVSTQLGRLIERQEAKEVAKISQSRLRAIIDNIPARMYLKDREGRYLMVNKVFEDFFNVSREELEGKTAEEVFDNDEVIKWTENDREVIEKGLIITKEISSKRYGGARVFLLTKFPVKDPDGKIYGYGGVSFDITEERRNRNRVHELLEREHEARKEAENATQARDEFISVASHELKSPITSLKLKIELMNRNYEKSSEPLERAKVQEALLKLDKDADRLLVLVNRLLDITRIQAGKLELSHDECNLNEIINNLIDNALLSPDGKLREIHLDIKDNIVGNWDKSRLEQVIVNLLTNAIKFGNDKPIHIEAHIVSDHVLLSIQDHGDGIDQGHLKKIFDRFERASAKEGIQGLGLGLYIVKQIVEAHGGTITVVSEVGSGSTFIVDLPLNLKQDKDLASDEQRPTIH